MNDNKVCWYVIYTKPRHEKKVVEQLSYLKVQHFLPTMRTLKIFGIRKKYVHIPLFPSYVFVKPDGVGQYFESLHIPGVLQYVKTGNQISGISETIINQLRAIGKDLHDNIQVSSEKFNAGSILNISAGPFTGYPCEVIQHKGKNKILVRIELLRRNVLLDLPEQYLTN